MIYIAGAELCLGDEKSVEYEVPQGTRTVDVESCAALLIDV